MWDDYLSNPKIAARFYKKLNNKTKCLTCHQGCSLGEGQIGYCKTRKVINDKLISLNYGNISSISLNPIEKKPLYHFYPGTYATTIGSWSCNFACPWCQNYSITKKEPDFSKESDFLSPEDLVKIITQNPNSKGISFSFNEPTLIAEYALDVMKILSKANPSLHSGFVTNGYMTNEVLIELINTGLSAMTISLKGGKEMMKKYCRANIDYIYENIATAYEKGIHIEIVVLVIPTVSDSIEFFEEISRRIVNDYSKDIPLHFNAYYPAYKFHKPRTEISTLEKAREIAMNAGLNYVYIGNILGHKALNTYCPNCQEIVISRSQSRFIENRLTENNCCKNCGYEIFVIK
ncbi:MAG: AmmeMemoRadiSam system radical SAM enzyme [Asgard group archaeon]|nr:AmmeMemoRadiSam system radical SAM enzyme [Asgard group archaeon]